MTANDRIQWLHKKICEGSYPSAVDLATKFSISRRQAQRDVDKLKSELLLEKIDSKPDTEFNPDFHEAVMVEDGEGEKEVISETLRPGYLYDGQVVRPAMVKVKRA